jgi:hypothetical protein
VPSSRSMHIPGRAGSIYINYKIETKIYSTVSFVM